MAELLTGVAMFHERHKQNTLLSLRKQTCWCSG